MITADSITDEQIRSILELPEYVSAKEADRPPWRSVAYDVRHSLSCSHERALCRPRARCAEILNARGSK